MLITGLVHSSYHHRYHSESPCREVLAFTVSNTENNTKLILSQPSTQRQKKSTIIWLILYTHTLQISAQISTTSGTADNNVAGFNDMFTFSDSFQCVLKEFYDITATQEGTRLVSLQIKL